MDSTLDGKLMERQLASLDELFSNLAREAGANPSDPPASIKTFRAPRQRLIDWRIGATWLSSVLCWQHPLVLLLGGGRPPLIRRWPPQTQHL